MQLSRPRGLRAALFAIALSMASAAPAAEPILTFQGEAATPIAMDMAALDAMPQTSFKTATPWQEGVVEFSGVSLKDYLTALHATPKQVRLVALNDYAVEADIAELLAGDALLATRQDGAPMPVSDKGPVFLIFPFDSRSELQHQTYYSRAVWQLAEIDVVE